MIFLKNKVLCALCMLTWLGIPSSTSAQDAKTNHSTLSMDSLSYALGVLFANNLSNEGLSSVDGASLKSGFEATLAGEATMTAAESASTAPDADISVDVSPRGTLEVLSQVEVEVLRQAGHGKE